MTLYTSNQLSHYHGILAELTSAKKDFVVTDKHRDAFEKSKKLLTEEPLFLNYPNPLSPRVLYVDSSEVLCGAVLIDAELPSVELVEGKLEDLEKNEEDLAEVQKMLKHMDIPGIGVNIRSKYKKC